MQRVMSFLKNKLRGLAVWSICVLVAACNTDEWKEQGTGMALKEGEIALQWLPANMGVRQVKTRATDPKTALEQQIHNVHVFIFTADGEYLESSGANAFQGYRYLEGSQNLVLNSELFENQPEASSACVYVLANIPRDWVDADGNGMPDAINNRDELEALSFDLLEFTATLPETGLPMVLRKDDVNLSTNATSKVVLLQLRSMMARVDLNFTMAPDQYDEGSPNPSLRIDKVVVGNFPVGGTIVPQLNSTASELTEGVLINEPKSVEWEGIGQPIRRDGGEVSLTLYMFEHSRKAKSLYDVFESGKYPENITPVEMQRYKNSLAADDAAYIELEGVYTNHNNYDYKVTYRLYPGANPDNDFTIKSNCQYKNNITITGITVNQEGEEALLDTRVNIDKTANPYFIEMLRERKHDAHFNVTPMDIFLYEEGSSVKVEILDAVNCPWLRMEPYKVAHDANDMSKYDFGEGGTGQNLYAARFAGDGKRKYFTTDLLDELDRQAGSKSYTVTWNDEYATSGTEKTYEERIYFYIDENVPMDAGSSYSNLDENGNVRDRSAQLRITYTSPSGEQESREVEIAQYGMLRVPFDKFETGGSQWAQGRDGYDFYIEYYEEYLEHYDGKNTYDETYDGLEWGFMGIPTNLDGRVWHSYLDYGWRNTMFIMRQFRDQLGPDEPQDIDLNTRPRGAAEYCYNKNKRNADGEVEQVHWYLPTISELEYALERYYGTFDVFQSQWYWSSNPGCASGAEGEDNTRARATQIINDRSHPEADEEGWVHFQSEADKVFENGLGGSALRSEVFRIRAAYIHNVEKDRHNAGNWWNKDDAPPSIDNRGNL